MTSRLRTLFVIGLPWAFCACHGGPTALEWRVELHDSVAVEDVVALHAGVRTGRCDGEVLWEERRTANSTGMMPPPLMAGEYALVATARDASCRIIGEGCTPVTIPHAGPSPVVVVVSETAPRPACASSDCVEGRCTAADAGMPDDGGAETDACPAGMADCNGDPSDGCETPLDTTADCGACSRPCVPSHASAECSARVCEVASCDEDWLDCDGRAANGCEVNRLSDRNNCGACDAECRLSNANGTCVGGACVDHIDRCDMGFDDCDGAAGNGCETALDTDTDCGECGNECGPVPRGTTTCGGSGCELSSCDAGFADCDGDLANGCETDIVDDPTSCGSCGTDCTNNAVASCSAGVCQLDSCLSGFADCNADPSDGCETDLSSNARNCGACGNACPFLSYCCDGNCQASLC